MRQLIKKSIAEANNINQTKQLYSLVVDGCNLLKIALVDKRMNNDGREYGAVLNFIRMLGNILLKKDFDYCYVCWDGEGSGILRWQHYKDYKANRDKHYDQSAADPIMEEYLKKYKDYSRMVIEYSRQKRGEKHEENDEEIFKRQKKIIQEILEELCIRQYEFANVEGDDIMSMIVKNRLDNERIVIVSSDKDLTQLISDTVIIYNQRKKEYITKDNAVKEIGVLSENVVLEKMICGDVSDNIKGVKGVGNETLGKLFPEIKDKKIDLGFILRRSRELLDERKAEKKKPLKSLENILNGVTDGCQGDRLYEINEKIIDLSKPLLTDEARETMDDEFYAPIDTSDRNIKNIYEIVKENKVNEILDEEKFGNILEPFGRIIMMETRRFKEYELERKNTRE